MKRIIGASIVCLLAGLAGAAAQSQAPQGATGQSSNSQVPPPKPVEPKRSNSGPPYSDCYMKCINSGNPGDYCQINEQNFCSRRK
jgi:hypothetical protein